MVQQQQRMGRGGRVVSEGRDVTTIVFPDADVEKIYSRWHNIIEIMGYDKPKNLKD